MLINIAEIRLVDPDWYKIHYKILQNIIEKLY